MDRERFIDYVLCPSNEPDGGISLYRPLAFPYDFSKTTGKLSDRRDRFRRHGTPSAVVGFRNDEHGTEVELTWDAAVNDPQSIVGKYPIFTDRDGERFNLTVRIYQVVIEDHSSEFGLAAPPEYYRPQTTASRSS